MSTSNPNPNDLSQSFGDAAPAPCATGPDLMELAEYVDGRVSDRRRQVIEAHLVSCDACREAVADASEARLERDGSPLVFVSPSVIEAAAALVSGDLAARGRAHAHILKEVRASPQWITIVRRGVAVAALIAICFAGHAVGTLISGATANSSDSLGVAMSFGLTDSSDQSNDDGELFALSLSEASS